MDIGKVAAVLESPTEDAIRDLLEDDGTVFWIDWRQDDETIAEIAREPVFLCDAGVLAMSSAAFYVFLGSAPFVLRSYGVGPGTVGLYIMVAPLSYMVGNFMASRLVRRGGTQRMAWTGQGLTLGGIVLMMALAAIGLRAPMAFVGPLMGIGHGLLLPPALAATVGVIPALAGAAAAVAGVGQLLMGAVGGHLAGSVPHDTPLAAGGLMLLFTLAAVASQAGSERVGRAHARA